MRRRWIGSLARLASCFTGLLLALAASGFTSCGEPGKAAKQPIALEDIYRLEAMRGTVLSPDGSCAVGVRQWIDPDTQAERQALWVVRDARDSARPLEPDEPDGRAPVFAPDGKRIAFLSTRSRPEGWDPVPPAPPQSDAPTDVWLIVCDESSRALPLAGPKKPYGRVFNDGFYGRVAFAPDGRRLAFVADSGKDPRTPEEIANNVRIVREDQGEGYTGYGPAAVWIAELSPNGADHAAIEIERVTPDDEAWYGDPQWSPDGRMLVVHANRSDDRESVRYSINKNFDLWAIDLESRAIRRLTSGPGPEVSPRFAPDGKRLACLSIPRKGSHMDAFNLTIVTLRAGDAANTRTLFDHHDPAAGDRPHPPPVFPLPDDCWDRSDHLIYNASLRSETPAYRVALDTGQGVPLADVANDASEGAKRFAHRAELTPAGNRFLDDRLQAETRLVSWDNGEGMEIEGLVTVPPAEVAQAPYPLVLAPHGGPHGRSARGFDFTVQLLAAHGYAVFQPNFRGSQGYGQKFVDADRSDFGGGDMRDILSGIDKLARDGTIDPERQFVYGVSYGGFMTCWLVGHTTQFRAAVAQNAVTDLNVMWGLSDLKSWPEWEFGGRPWEVPAALRAHSPITYAAAVRTPTLILHSRDDRRCPIAMGRMFYESLKASGVETGMVIYPDEGHGIRQPRHRADVLRRVLDWFAEHDAR